MVSVVKGQVSEIAVEQVRPHIRKFVTSVEYFEAAKPSKTHAVYRVKFKDVEEYGYVTVIEDGAVLIHYCDNVKSGTNCRHRSILGAIAEEYGYKIYGFNNKSSLKDFKAYEKPMFDCSWINDNDRFLISSDEDFVESTVANTSAEETTPAILTASEGEVIHLDWRKDLNAIEDYLESQKIEAAIQTKILELRKSISEDVPLRANMIAPKKPKMPYQGEMFEEAMTHILLGKHLLLIGDAGTGKDTLINTISWVLNYPVLLQVGSKDETKESIVAEPAFLNNESTYQLSMLSKTVHHGGLVNFAEINFLQGSTTSVLHPLFDENNVLPTPLGGIEANKYVLFCASMNVGEGYGGVNRLNKAFKDRFAVLRLRKTLSFKESLTIKTGLTDRNALEFLEAIQKGMKELFVENIAIDADTVRGYIDAANYFYHFGYSHKTRCRAIDAYIINRIEEADEYFQARETIRDIFQELKLNAFPTTDEEAAYMASIGA